jgi:pimeloyl-ACP methyl ester carboxylesterase
MMATPRLRRPAVDAELAPVRVLLLHGMGGGVSGWDPLDPLLSTRFELWDVAFPWSTGGDTSWTHDADVTRLAAAAIETVDADVVVAHSFAANVLLELVDLEGPRWDRPIVLISPFYRPTTGDFDWSVIGSYVEGFRRMLDDGIRLRAGSRIDDVTRADMVGRLCELMGPYTWLRFFDTFLRTPLLKLDRIYVPVLVVGGEFDEGALADGARALATRIPLASARILADCGHFPMVERPEALAGSINDFISSLPGVPGRGNHTDRILERNT